MHRGMHILRKRKKKDVLEQLGQSQKVPFHPVKILQETPSMTEEERL